MLCFCRRFINATDSHPKDLDVTLLFGKIGAKGEYNEWMLRETLANNVDGLKAWQTTIRMLGTAIHASSGTQLLNSLLSIAEKAFKTDNVEVRKETFRCWEVLMDNFSLNEATLNHQKRMRLLTRPLVVSYSRVTLASCRKILK